MKIGSSFKPAEFRRVSDQSINFEIISNEQMFKEVAANKTAGSSYKSNHALILNQTQKLVNFS